jgi:hypothetical protein
MLESDLLALEKSACTPEALNAAGFNPRCVLPHGLTVDHVRRAMQDFLDFLGFINTQLNSRSLLRLEAMLMPANFSSMVGEFEKAAIPKYCPWLVRNGYHNGHPDMLPAGRYANNAVQYEHEGIEVKASRRPNGW